MRRLIRSVRIAASEIRARPGQAALAAVSLVVGVLAVVAVATVGTVTRDVFIATSEQRHGRAPTLAATMSAPRLDAATVADLVRFCEEGLGPGGGAFLSASTESATAIGLPQLAERNEPLTLQAVEFVQGDIDAVRRVPVLAGRWLSAEAAYPPELVLNQSAAARWGGPSTQLAVLATSDAGPVRAVVVGVVSDGSANPVVYASLGAFARLRPSILRSGTVDLMLHSSRLPPARVQATFEAAARAEGLTVVAGTLGRADNVAPLLDDLHTQQRAFLALAALTLFISALGMMNIGLATVGERAHELVVRRAVGATRSDLAAQTILTGLLTSVAAAAVACAIAAAVVAWWVPSRIDPATAITPPTLPLGSVAIGVGSALVTAVAGSLAPAVRAARLDVARALRF